MIDIEIFDYVKIFSLLNDEERQVLPQEVSTRYFDKASTIFRAGEQGESAFLVQAGLVHVIQDNLVIDVVKPGGLFGMSAMLADSPHLSTAVALEESQVTIIGRNDIDFLLTKRPAAGLGMMTMM